MRYLLRQRFDIVIKERVIDFAPLNCRIKERLIYLFPNEFSANLIKFANKGNYPFKKIYEKGEKYSSIAHYEFKEIIYNKLIVEYKEQIKAKRTSFEKKPLLYQLVLLLRYTFKRNKQAKKVHYFAKQRAYEDKNIFLKKVLELASKINNPNFNYGWQFDPEKKNYPNIYYFQIGKLQVSFHHYKKYENCPDFEGTWIGYELEEYPIKLNEIKCLIK